MSKTMRIGIAMLSIALVTGALSSCSKSSKVTSPGGTIGGAAELNGSLAAGGGQYAHTFATAGTFNYHCTIHPGCTGLAGTVVVIAAGGAIQNRALAVAQAGGSGGIYGGATCSSLSPQRDTVFVGDQVTWTNNSPLPHTVSSQ